MDTPKLSQKIATADTLQFKIVADDAAKAVKTIKEKFGASAKVISVNQVEGSGLTGLLKKPRLEIIVEAKRAGVAAASKEPKEPESSADSSDAPKETAPEPASTANGGGDESAKTPIQNLYSEKDSSSADYFSGIDTSSETVSRPRLGSAANPIRRGTMEYVERAVSMLRSVGFDDMLIERIRFELDFKRMGSMPTMEIYNRICDWLRRQFPEERATLKGDCRAFIGASGSGKTAALSKALSAEIFVEGKAPVVLKIDGSVPNSSDSLEAFCDILGAPLYRSEDEIDERSADKPIYVDTPGLNWSDASAVDACRERLDELGVDERILVVNAAYESEVIAETMVAGTRLGATHVVFTHLDETRKAGKLWKYALSGGIQPLFFSHGPNPAGDYTKEPLSYLLAQTFPQGRQIAAADRAESKAGDTSRESSDREVVAVA